MPHLNCLAKTHLRFSLRNKKITSKLSLKKKKKNSPNLTLCHLKQSLFSESCYGKGDKYHIKRDTHLGPVVQSIISLTSSLRGQLVWCFMALQPNTLIFFVEKMIEAFALQKLLTFFLTKKILAYIRY